jgi:hypothetical protein
MIDLASRRMLHVSRPPVSVALSSFSTSLLGIH